MAADLTGIVNEGEFFSQHYLDEILERDIKETLKSAQQGGQDTAAALKALGRDYFRTLGVVGQLTHPEKLYAASRDLQIRVAETLGYTYQSGRVLVLGDHAVPILHEVERAGQPYLIVLEGRFRSEDEALLDLPFAAELPAKAQDDGLEPVPAGTTLGDVIGDVFSVEPPPRWVVLVSGQDLVLGERARWGKGRYLRFDLGELLARKDSTALDITAALLSRATIAPSDGTPVHDTLDERSHKHAHGVSKELKYAARDAVELLGNEYVHWERTTGKKALYTDQAARELTDECLTYLYRLLFLFYAEARADELGSLPMKSEEYARGYSLEILRELEQVPLSSPEAQDGTFFDTSLKRLFELVNEGHDPYEQTLRLGDEETRLQSMERGFTLRGVHSPLFDARSTPRLSRAKLRNRVLQQVVRLLSLSPEGRRGRGRSAYGRGRISYALLGINELGAVYEGLLSYTGFFSKGTLYEVHRAGEKRTDKTQQAYFVPEKDLDRYSEDELTFEEEDGTTGKRRYPPGTFIFRLAGRDRESSASYYTPEVLTRCLVKYSLKELLKDKSADDILALTICEPAMGSGAFLVEAISQLADAYLERKQAETGQKVPPERYTHEKQRVNAYIAANNCYGVDLNPTAARLAGVSLWLATMHAGQETPWFGARLAVGNSLVGARLEVWQASDLESDDGLAKKLSAVLKKAGNAGDFEEQVEAVLRLAEKSAPEAVEAVRKVFEAERRALEDDSEADDGGEDRGEAARTTTIKDLKKLCKDFRLPRCHRKPPTAVPAQDVIAGKRPKGSFYHWLLLDPGMSPFDGDKAIKELAPKEVELINKWRKAIGKKYTRADAERLARLSDRIDELYHQAATERCRVLEFCRTYTPVWGQAEPTRPTGGYQPIRKREQALALLRQPGSAFGRLEAAMDLWSALWAWPIETARLLPAQGQVWAEMERLLGLDEAEPVRTVETQLELLIQAKERESEPPSARDVATESEVVAVARRACEGLRPHHWELEFGEVFAERGGFDLAVGNPPWIRLEWKEQGVLEELDPRLALDSAGAAVAAVKRRAVVAETDQRSLYLQEAAGTMGAQAFLGSAANFDLLAGIRPNLYKCFICLAWRLGSESGVVGLVHQDGIFDDGKGKALRAAFFRRCVWVCRFKNEFKLFADIGDVRPFAFSVSSSRRRRSVAFAMMCNLFHPRTIDESLAHDGSGRVPGIKTDENAFESRGHLNRVVRVGEEELDVFSRLFGDSLPIETQLPLVHSTDALVVLRKLANYPYRLRDVGGEVVVTNMFDETGEQKDGTIRRDTQFPDAPQRWILSGPHFYIGTPFNKTPREVCETKAAYDVIELSGIGDSYLPRTNYVPACEPDRYFGRIPKLGNRSVTEFYRHIHRDMLAITGERTLIPALIPPGPAHIHACASVAMSEERTLLAWSALSASLVVDFWVRSRGAAHLGAGQVTSLPAPSDQSVAAVLRSRWLRLNCLTTHYRDIWNRNWIGSPGWSSQSTRLSSWPEESRLWSREVSLRNQYERRWALLEVDVVGAIHLGLTAEQLCSIYRTQFPVLRGYDKCTWFDASGRVAFTNNKGLTGVGLDRKDFELWQSHLESGAPLPSDFDTQGLVPPFDVRDREADMRHAYSFFVKELGLEEPT